jgi:hypothetical protein
MAQWREKAQSAERGWNESRDRGPQRGGWGGGDRGERRDRDIPGVTPELNDARRELKAAISDALDTGDEDAQRRIADILRKAAELIRRRDVDLG